MRFVKLLHKWLGLIVGVQLLLWTTSGLMFSWLNHHEVAGEHSTRKAPVPTLTPAVSLMEPDGWLAEYGNAEIRDIRLMPLMELWIYRVELLDRVELRRANDGRRFVIDAPLARELALASYAGRGKLVDLARHDEPVLEARKAGPVWRADFDDAANTSLYLSAADGHFVAARNDTWRIFDFFWMLHTMDYRGRDNFNNPLVILAGTCAIWLALSGALLLSRSFRWQSLKKNGRGERI